MNLDKFDQYLTQSTIQDDREIVFIVDAYSFIFRAYYAQPNLKNKSGQPTGAIFGFMNMMLKAIDMFKPKMIIGVFDTGLSNFRHEIYDRYKANRSEVPYDLKVQLPLVREVAEVLNFTIYQQIGYEADDVIATLAKRLGYPNQMNESQDDANFDLNSKLYKVVILSSDKDLMQLIDDDIICMYDPMKAEYINECDVLKKFGIKPSLMADFLALVGDASDNIPGAAGIGPKTAVNLLNEFGSLDNILAQADHLPEERKYKLILASLDNIILSKKLTLLKDDVPLIISLSQLTWQAPKLSELYLFLQKYDFKSLLGKVERMFHFSKQHKENTLKISSNIHEIVLQEDEIQDAVVNLDLLKEMLNISKAIGNLVIIYENNMLFLHISNTLNNHDSNQILIGKTKHNVYETVIRLTPFFKELSILQEILEADYILKITCDLKGLLHQFASNRIQVKPMSCQDLSLMYYVCYVGRGGKNISKLEKIITGIMPEFEGDLKSMVFLASKAYGILLEQLKSAEIRELNLYHEIDLPLAEILFDIEQNGIKIDLSILSNLSEKITFNSDLIAQKIFALAGEEFNIASAKQVGQILFDKLKLPGSKFSPKSQNYVTNFKVLEYLSAHNVQIASYIILWRHLSKLKNTYVDVLPNLIDQNFRLHTTFLQTSTLTGRLSSINPNLQNIPTKEIKINTSFDNFSEYEVEDGYLLTQNFADEQSISSNSNINLDIGYSRKTDNKDISASILAEISGKAIRSAFISTGKEYDLISADYSQIELRILSYIAKVEDLANSFAKDIDVHRQTAAAIFNLPYHEINLTQRNYAKTINFSIIYGLSPFGLATQLNIPLSVAKNYIDSYFDKYPEITTYIDQTKDFVHKHGYVQNILGRKFWIQDINSSNHNIRKNAERSAINAPIQGTSADIIKLAMIKLNKILKAYDTRILLQIHDELLFESPKDITEKVMPIIKECMENTALALNLNLVVKIKSGSNWAELY